MRDLRSAPYQPPDLAALGRSLKTISVNFTILLTICCLLAPVFYFAAFHGECAIRTLPGPGGTIYFRLYQQEQFFFNFSISRKAWWELAENSANFDSSGFNGGKRIRWRGFGYIWQWEEPFDIVY